MHSANLSDQQQRRQEIVEERGQKKKGGRKGSGHLMRKGSGHASSPDEDHWSVPSSTGERAVNKGANDGVGLGEGWRCGGVTSGGRQQGCTVLVQEQLRPDGCHGNR